MASKKIRIGGGAGYSGDRIEPAVELAQLGDIQYLVFECLAERTIALAQQRKSKDATTGYDPLLEERMKACLPVCKKNNIVIISNMGAANPLAAMEKTAAIAQSLGIKNLKIAAVTGDDVLQTVWQQPYELLETGEPLESISNQIISANAYLGVQGIVEALNQQADIILTGRTADPALFLAPLIHEFGWAMTDCDLLGQGIVLGHLMECAGHITGGYFADPGIKEVPGLDRLGFPIAEIAEDGTFFITKIPEAGGMVSAATCKEQLLYEIHDPANYLTPDVVADFTQVTITEVGKDKVEIKGGKGKPKTGQLKVSIGYRDGFIGEGQISYGGPGAVDRGQLALEIVQKRMELIGLKLNEIRYDLIGLNTLYGNAISHGNPFEVRARVAARTSTRKEAQKIGNEVETLYTNGPAGGGGVTKSIQEVIAIQSILIDEKQVNPIVHYKLI